MKRLFVAAVATLLIAGPARSVRAQPGAGDATGPGLGAPTPTPNPLPATDPNLTEEERVILRDVEAEWQKYVDAADAHQARMRQILLGERDRRIAELERGYAERIAKTTADKAKWRADTKALLIAFIAEHPDHEQFTPDARFRLADILLNEADDAFNLSTSDAGIADYSASLEQWEKILSDFPKYRQLPSVLFLLAYYNKVNDERRSLQLFLSLVCTNHYKWTDPPPPLPTREEAIAKLGKAYADPYADCVPMDGAEPELLHHAWSRGIADYEFGIPGELDSAISGYLQVADKAKDSPLYAEALYKLAWSYYKHDLPVESIRRFDDSVRLYDATVAAGQQPRLELRDESIQYIAVAFTDPWPAQHPGDPKENDTDPVLALKRAHEFYNGRESEPHVRDVWASYAHTKENQGIGLGFAFLELQAYEQAIECFRIALGPPWELAPDNPRIHQEIVDAYDLAGDKISANAAAAELATRYAPGTPWYAANETNREAMDNFRRLAERALFASAQNTHIAANAARQEWVDTGGTDEALHQEYLALYEEAVRLYGTFIDQYPESDYVYLFTFNRGEALFYSGHYLESVDDYKWVRDHRDLSEEDFLDAAKGVVAAYQAEVDRQIEAGTLNPLVVPTKKELEAMPGLTAQPIPELYLALQAEWDTYQDKVPDPKSAPQQGLNAALVSMAYLHIDDALARFQKVVTNFCSLQPEEIAGKVSKVERKNGEVVLTIDTDGVKVTTGWDGALVDSKGAKLGAFVVSAPDGQDVSATVDLGYDAAKKLKRVIIYIPTHATRAKDAMVNIYDVTGQLDKLQAINQQFLENKCGSVSERSKAETQNRSIEFRRAGELLDNKQYIEAGEQFYTYYKNAPAGDKDLPTALYNAAVAYKLGDRPKTAISLFKEFTESKEKAFIESPFYLESMRLTAISYQSSYDYKNAISAYLALYDITKSAKKRGINPPDPAGDEKPQTLEQIGLDALYNAAVLYELDRDFDKAIAYYKKYDAEETGRRGKDRAWFAIARIYSQKGDVDKLIATYATWRKSYGNDKDNEDDLVFSYYDVAKLYQRKGKTKDATEWGTKAIKAWKDAGAHRGTRGAQLAGEYKLLFAERHFQDVFLPYEAIKKPKKPKDKAEATKLINATLAETKKAQAYYCVPDPEKDPKKKKTCIGDDDLWAFGVLELSYASLVRVGDAASEFVVKLKAIPYSKEIEAFNAKHPDAGILAAYDEALDLTLKPFLKVAKTNWVYVVDEAKKAGISNQWSQLALENLNRDYPDEFPVLHQEIFEGTDKPGSANP